MQDNNDSLQIENICKEFIDSWSPDAVNNLNVFLDKAKPDTLEVLLRRLLREDVSLRKNASQSVSASDYKEVHPRAEEVVSQLLRAGDKSTNRDAQSQRTDQGKSVSVAGTITAAHDGDRSATRHAGKYRLLQQIGEGGMGAVWMAEQSHPIRRKVAVKVIRKGITSQQSVARFEAERQALAMMEHPSIARVIDVGVTNEGTPFYAMELVKGSPLTNYCDDQRVSIGERLRLFIEICNGVQHAHQKGIIHRDLKPDNILVCEVDGKATPKIIDFGLAKAIQLETRLTDKTMFTEFGQILGTIQYMSPEQSDLNDLNIDTRSDIYALGVILYQLIVGSTPIDSESVRGQPVLEVLNRVREEEPARPSARLSSQNADLDKIALQRSVTPSKLAALLRKELDWIILKALEKSPGRRYQTASELGQELQRFIDGDAVSARPQSVSYRTQKFIRKHRGPVAALMAISLTLVAGIAGSVWFAIKANESKNLESSAKTEALRQKNVAYERLDMAMEAVENYYSNINKELVFNKPEFAEVRAKLLSQPAEFFQRLVADLKDERSIAAKSRLAKGLFMLGKVQLNQGDGNDAMRCLESASEIFLELSAEVPDSGMLLSGYIESEYTRVFHIMKQKGVSGELPESIKESIHTMPSEVERLRHMIPEDPNVTATCLAVNVLSCLALDPNSDSDRESYKKYMDNAMRYADEVVLSSLNEAGLGLAVDGYSQILQIVVLTDNGPQHRALPIISKLIGFLESGDGKTIPEATRLNWLAEFVNLRIIYSRTKTDDGDSLPDFLRLYELRVEALEMKPTDRHMLSGSGRAAYSIAARYKERLDFENADQWARKAKSHYQEVLAIDPSAVFAVAMLGMINQLHGDVLMALERYEDAIAAFGAVKSVQTYHGGVQVGNIDVSILYAQSKLGQTDAVLASVKELSEQLDPAQSFSLAQALSACIEGTDDVEKKAELHIGALELLEHSLTSSQIERNLQTFENSMRDNTDFDALREEDEFQRIFAKLKAMKASQ